MTKPLSRRAAKALLQEKPWGPAMYPDSTSPGWERKEYDTGWEIPSQDWHFNGKYWVRKPSCKLFLEGQCQDDQNCMDYHPPDPVAEIRALANFQAVADHITNNIRPMIEILAVQAQQPADVRRRASLVLVGDKNLGYSKAVRKYHEFLCMAGVLPKHSRYRDFSTEDNCCLAYMGYLCKEDDKIPGGVLLINQPSSICPYGWSMIDDVQASSPELVIVLVKSGIMLHSSLDDGVKRFAFTLHLQEPSLGLDNRQTRIRERVIKSIHLKYGKNMQVEGGIDGSYFSTYIRKISQDCGKQAGKKAIDKAVDASLYDVLQRQLDRLLKLKGSTETPEYYLLTASDLLGQMPDLAGSYNKEWEELQTMIGLEAVKTNIKNLFDGLLLNYYRGLDGKEPLQIGLSRIFLGPPGTGKTTVAKLYGKLLAKLGVLSSGKLDVKNASDFIGQYLGQSVAKTKKILKDARGNVLLIDEAYMLDAERNRSSTVCPYRQEVLDTLVGEVQNVPGEDLCVIMCGYEKEMRDFLREANPGIARRFSIDNAFVFEEFDDEQLGKVLDLKMKKQSLRASSEARAVALNVLKLAKQRPNFGNGGEIDNLLSRAMLSFQRRFSTVAIEDRSNMAREGLLIAEDFDPEYLRGRYAETEMDQDLGMIGMGTQLNVIKELVRQSSATKKYNMDPKDIMPFTLVLKGPPGSGKTAFARKLGRLYYNMGILASQEVVEASWYDMVGTYSCAIGYATKRLLQSGLGKVLIIDGAYRLNGKGSSVATEVRDELIDALTKPQFYRKIVVVLVGYTALMDELLASSLGVAGKFPTQIEFEKISSAACCKLLKRRIEYCDVSAAFSEDDDRLRAEFEKLRSLKVWANGRSVETLADEIVRRSVQVVAEQGNPELAKPAASLDMILDILEAWRRRHVTKVTTKKRKAPDKFENGRTTGPPDQCGISAD